MNSFELRFDRENCRRVISEKDVIIHCHHYNSRLQRTVEDVRQIDGRGIIISSAEAVFSEMCRSAIGSRDEGARNWTVAASLYSHLGYGKLDFSEIDLNVIKASAAHFVEGWKAGFASRNTPVCTFTEGYLQGAYHAVTGKVVHVREKQCMIHGADACVFEVVPSRKEPLFKNEKRHPVPDYRPKPIIKTIQNRNIDHDRIVDALVEMPIRGNLDGLIPAFGVYLANTPADFYNLVCIRFVEEMQKVGLLATAKNLLMTDAETCGMNTFRGIMNSAEWDGLIAPMIKERQDRLFGIIAVSNGLGWGNWHIVSHVAGDHVGLVSLNGYEALGYRGYRQKSDAPLCLMLTGVAAGIMELVYGEGSFDDRIGTFKASEEECICRGDERCEFKVVKRT